MQNIDMTVYPGVSVEHLKFYDKKNNCHLDSIWPQLCNGLWRSFRVDDFLFKTPPIECFTFEPDAFEYFPNIIALPAGYIWDDSTKKIKQDLYTPRTVDASEANLLAAIEQYLLQFRDKKVGVHLSGGLDSSIIIGLLDYFGIDFIPIGYTSQRFEARTERTIQHILAEKYPNSILLDLDDYTEFEDIDKPLKTQIPTHGIRFGASHKLMPRLFKENGVQTVFTGQGADSLLGDAIPSDSLTPFNIPALFEMTEQEYYLYRPYGLRLEPFFADHRIIDQISNLRRGKGQDGRKLWARNFFKKFIPQELVDYHYVGDFFGHTISGLIESKDKIRELFSQTYAITSNELFNPKVVDDVDVLSFDIANYGLWCSKISYGLWLTSLFSNT